jgi:hypothetical protein
MWFLDLTNKQFGRLTVLRKLPLRSWGSIVWECQCRCGKTVSVNGASLRKKVTHSCGCLMREQCSILNSRPDAARNKVWGSYISRARTLRLHFSLSKRRFTKLILGDCHYCGQSPSRRSVSFSGHSILYNGIDRINPKFGYTRYNSVSCCTTCNMMKKAMTLEAFISHMKRIASHWGKTHGGL